MIRLHHCPQTRSMRSPWLLHELGLELEVITHPFGKNLRDPAFQSSLPTDDRWLYAQDFFAPWEV